MKRCNGFTLIELLVVIAIAAILVALAVPAFTTLVRSTNVASAVNTFLSDTRFARSEAIRLGGTVTMCRSSDPEAASPDCGSGSTVGWESGWIIFLDQNRDGTVDANADESLDDRVLRIQAPIGTIGSIYEAGAATKLKFTSTGRLLNTSSATTVTFGGSYDLALIRKICISLGGRARIETASELCPP
ncbi:MAG: pilus assembly protein [Burkholderiales bacterium PBB3]|nr:MAG: pilus assembly protein [Burkholderiales bacterium PBB3]